MKKWGSTQTFSYYLDPVHTATPRSHRNLTLFWKKNTFFHFFQFSQRFEIDLKYDNLMKSWVFRPFSFFAANKIETSKVPNKSETLVVSWSLDSRRKTRNNAFALMQQSVTAMNRNLYKNFRLLNYKIHSECMQIGCNTQNWCSP